MANINLNELFKKQQQIVSEVDSNIKFNQPQNVEEIYSDYKLDLNFYENKTNTLNTQETSLDVEKIVNEEAVINSLKNILNTTFYSRLLNPDMNFDLRTYLFEDLTESKAFFIGYDISNLLPVYEPRVVVSNVKVTAYYEDDTYKIDLSIGIPTLKKEIKLSSVLNSDGFIFT
jgi:phage baseplate assembly protein W